MTTNVWTGKASLTTLEALTNDGFWPDLAMADLMNWMRIPSEYADDTIKRELIIAIIEINRQLSPVKSLLIVAYANLAAYCTANSQQINGTEILITKYQEAVFCYAKAVLLQQFKTMNRKEEAENMAKESAQTEQDWLDRSRQAVLFFFKKFALDPSILDSADDIYLAAI